MGWPLRGISAEARKEANRALESKFPSTLFVEGGVEAVTEEEVRRWGCEFLLASLVLLGAGPPCQRVLVDSIPTVGGRSEITSIASAGW